MHSEHFYILEAGEVELNAGRETRSLSVSNTGDRPIQVGSHAHFFEVNSSLIFDRQQAFGMRLDIPAGTAVRFEPGDIKDIVLVAFGGLGRATGMSGLVQGDTRTPGAFDRGIARAAERGFPLTPEGEKL